MTSKWSLEEFIIVNDANQGNILKQDKPNTISSSLHT